MASTQQSATPGETEVRPRSGAAWQVFLVGVPVVWIVVALVHPQGNGDVYDELQDQVGLWLGVHFAQLVLALGLAMVFWVLLAGRTGTTATVARLVLPVWLVAFSTFDSVTGIASGLAVHHANGLDGPEQAGAASTAEYLVDNRFTADFSLVWFLQAASFLTVVIATALVLRSGGASGWLFAAMLGGVLLVFHAGAIAAIGLLAIAAAIVLAYREGLIRSDTRLLPTG
jgi:hypothetical protein